LDDRTADYATASGVIAPDQAKYGGVFAAGAPASVRAYPSSRAGIYGLCGNVWEWSSTHWDDHCVIKGGSFLDAPEFCATEARYRNAPIDRDCSVGFRVWIAS
jgi:formylglycine-generating enzyme required for sulfatase activity